MVLWRRLAITVGAILVVSLLAGLAWKLAFNAVMPGYLSGVIGGLAALPVWEFTRSR